MRPLKHNLIEPEISLKPLFDVSLVLVIMLLVVAPMLRTGVEASAPVQGPNRSSRGAAAPAAVPGAPPAAPVLSIEDPQLALAMEADGTLYMDGHPVALRELQSKLGEIYSLTPNRPVIVKGARRLRYEQIRWILQSVSAAGFRRAGLAADPLPPR